MESMVGKARSPLKDKPLRNPGQGLDEELQRLWDEKASPYYWFSAMFVALAVIEWIAYLRDAPRSPILYSILAIGFATFFGWRLWKLRAQARRLKLGRDGERAVGQFLEGLRVNGARIFHDVPADDFNLDHVVISSRGLIVVETKTRTKPHPKAQVTFDGREVLIDGRAPDRDPIAQVRGEVEWLKRMLAESTGRDLPIRGVVVFPGWWVEQTNKECRRDTWVLEPKALPTFIENECEKLVQADVALAAYHLGRYIRAREE